MGTLTSLTEIQETGVTLRADEAVAIVQQLIHNPIDGDPPIDPPHGPPAPDNVYLDEEGFVTCRACAITPAVSEIAILLQALLPPGTPLVPGALRYTMARALLDVDAPPFDSVHDLSDALARFERGDRTAVVRALVARAQSVCLDRMRLVVCDRRRLMPTPTEFRRELRAADARYYELVGGNQRIVPGADTRVRPYTVVSADQRIVPAADTCIRTCTLVGADPRVGPGIAPSVGAAAHQNPPPERRRASALAIGVAIGLGLIRVGEFMHTRSAPFRPAVVNAQPAPDRDPAPFAPQPEQDAVRLPPTPAAVPVATTGPRVENVAKPVAKRAVRRATPPAPAPRARKAKSGGVMDRPPLRWLRNAFTVRSEPL
jgi:hypothetical protein